MLLGHSIGSDGKPKPKANTCPLTSSHGHHPGVQRGALLLSNTLEG